MGFFKKLLPSLISIGLAVGAAASPQVQGYISSHPVLGGILAGVLGVVNHWLPSPTQ